MRATNEAIRTVDVDDRRAWRAWLDAHHRSERAVWLVFHKRHTGRRSIAYDDAVEEALCFGWIDSIVRRLDADRYARKFTPRTVDSRWSSANRRRYAALRAQGLLSAAGRARAPTQRSGDAPRPDLAKLPPYIDAALRADPRVLRHFQALAPSRRRALVGWIDSAKREATRAKRLAEAVRRLRAGQTIGLK